MTKKTLGLILFITACLFIYFDLEIPAFILIFAFALVMDYEKGKKIKRLIESRNWRKLKRLFERKPELLNAKNYSGFLLFEICNTPSTGHLPERLKLVNYILDQQPELVNQIHPFLEQNVLFSAISSCDVPLVKLLCERGADVHFLDSDKAQPLAYYFDHEFDKESAEICQILIDHGAEVNHKDEGNFTALYAAIYDECVSAVKVLLENGADPLIKNDEGQTPLDLAMREDCKNQAILDLLEPYMQQNCGNDVNRDIKIENKFNMRNEVHTNLSKSGKTLVPLLKESGELQYLIFRPELLNSSPDSDLFRKYQKSCRPEDIVVYDRPDNLHTNRTLIGRTEDGFTVFHKTKNKKSKPEKILDIALKEDVQLVKIERVILYGRLILSICLLVMALFLMIVQEIVGMIFLAVASIFYWLRYYERITVKTNKYSFRRPSVIFAKNMEHGIYKDVIDFCHRMNITLQLDNKIKQKLEGK